MRILDAAQMREADRRTIEEIGIPSIVLMENAGRQVVAALEAHFDDLATARVAVLCGRGSNGGDGFVVARTLLQRGVRTSVFLVGRVADVRGDARLNLDILGHLGVSVVEIANAEAWELHASEVTACDVIIDAITGTGLSTPLTGVVQTIVGDVNAAPGRVVAVDLPTGLSADTHEIIGDSIDATLTVTLAAPKIPHILPPAENRVGDLVVADIGIPAEILSTLEGPWLELLTRDQAQELIVARHPETHKGDYGRILIVAGSPGKTGAAHLAARGALRSGAGLVTVATPRSVAPVVASLGAEYMTEPLAECADGLVDPAALDRVLAIPTDVIAVGPGLGLGPGPRAFVRELLSRVGVPLVLDADGLTAFADDPRQLRGRDGVDVIITPHAGELARLMGTSVEAIQARRVEMARSFATTHRLLVILKGHRTLIATPEGQVYVNLTGNPGMATGGTGDVLTGMVAAWCAQLLDCEAASKLAVHVHGIAGDLAAAEEGEVAMIASDLADRIGDALNELTGRRPRQPDQA